MPYKRHVLAFHISIFKLYMDVSIHLPFSVSATLPVSEMQRSASSGKNQVPPTVTFQTQKALSKYLLKK